MIGVDEHCIVKHFPQRDTRLQGKLRTVARQMRHEPTPAEDCLWQRLRGRQFCEYKFHRQHRIDRFVVDFYCASAALIIEVDGGFHRQQVDADQERENILTDLGFHILRFTNTQVLKEIDQVVRLIQDTLEGRRMRIFTGRGRKAFNRSVKAIPSAVRQRVCAVCGNF